MIPLSPFGILFAAIATILILAVPRRIAAAPLMVGVCYMVLGQGIEIGPFHFFVIRLLVLVGLVRVLIRGERPSFGLNRMDQLMIAWAIWTLVASFFRPAVSDTLVSNLGLVFNVCGIYFLLRIFLTTLEDVEWLCRFIMVLLGPIALEMVYEQFTSHNFFSILGGVAAEINEREGRLRSQGPFAHAILAGTVGAVCLPLAIALWKKYRVTAIFGAIACITIVFTSASSGPLMSAIFSVVALLLWPMRLRMKVIRWGLVATYLLLEVTMKVPPYFILARIDVAGGSTGWHRAELIDSALHHLSEWWLAGTDYTRHWMPTGVSWSPNHTDITNHYLQMGVNGGLLCMLLFIATIAVGYQMAGKTVRKMMEADDRRTFFVWALGASLFAHTATAISVSYFDQSYAFVYLTLAAIATVAASVEESRQPVINEVPKTRPGGRGRRLPRANPAHRAGILGSHVRGGRR